MPTPDFTVKRHDFGQTILFTFKDADGEAMDLTGYTSAKAFMTRMAASSPTINGESFTVITAATGECSYTWQDGDTDTSGEYKLEFEVELPGKRVTYPTKQANGEFYLIVLVQDDLGDADDLVITGWSLDFSQAQNSGYLAAV